jgi:hypothetical protein
MGTVSNSAPPVTKFNAFHVSVVGQAGSPGYVLHTPLEKTFPDGPNSKNEALLSCMDNRFSSTASVNW